MTSVILVGERLSDALEGQSVGVGRMKRGAATSGRIPVLCYVVTLYQLAVRLHQLRRNWPMWLIFCRAANLSSIDLTNATNCPRGACNKRLVSAIHIEQIECGLLTEDPELGAEFECHIARNSCEHHPPWWSSDDSVLDNEDVGSIPLT